MTNSPTTQQETPFGLLHALTLGTLLFMGALFAVPLKYVVLPPIPLLEAGLWGLEAVVFLLCAWLWSRHPLVTVIGLGLGLATRLVANLLILLLLRLPTGNLFGLDTQNSAYHAWAIVLAVLAYLLAYRGLLEARCGLSAPPAVVARGKAQTFAFNTAKAPPPAPPRPTSHPPRIVTAGGMTSSVFVPEKKDAEPVLLAPPEGFVPVSLQSGVSGMVNLPAKVVLDSVPEAKGLMLPNSTLYIPMGYFTPQLPNATAWLTWQQIFEKGVGVTEAGEARKDANFLGRWVMVPPRYYVPQIASSYFSQKKTPPRWMSLPEVPQEAEIKFE